MVDRMVTALLTGPKHQTSRVGESLRVRGGDIVVADSREAIAALPSRLPERSVGAYVQFLMEADARSSWAPRVTERIETMALVAPLLAPDAGVVLVVDDPADPAQDQRVADGLRLLAEAALSSADARAMVSVLQEGTPQAISGALHQGGQHGVTAPLADLGADRPYADWRTDILSLASSTDVTCFGWVNQEGCARVGLLRGSVLSPLPVPPGSVVAWGTTDPEPGARTLSGALLAATLGGQSVDNGLVDLFIKDVIGSLPPGGFELSVSEVERWLRQQLGETPSP